MFDEKLFLEVANELGIEIIKEPGKDMINGKEVNIMQVLFDDKVNAEKYSEIETISIEKTDENYEFADKKVIITKDKKKEDKLSTNFEFSFAA